MSAGAELGQCYLDRGELARGLGEIQTSLRLLVEHDVKGGRFLGLIHMGLARAHLLLAEAATGSARAEALRQAGAACRTARRIAKTYRPWQAEAERLQGTWEWLRGRPAAARKWWQRSLSSAEPLDQRYDQALTYLAMGRYLGDEALLKRGQQLLAAIRGPGLGRAVAAGSQDQAAGDRRSSNSAAA